MKSQCNMKAFINFSTSHINIILNKNQHVNKFNIFTQNFIIQTLYTYKDHLLLSTNLKKGNLS